jgi:hypothetical protein
MNLGEISVTRGEDTFCRYTTGAYGSRSEALTALRQIRPMGYPKAFVRKVRTQL